MHRITRYLGRAPVVLRGISATPSRSLVRPLARPFHLSHPVRNDDKGKSRLEVDLPVEVPGPGTAGPQPNTGGASGSGFSSTFRCCTMKEAGWVWSTSPCGL